MNGWQNKNGKLVIKRRRDFVEKGGTKVEWDE